ncbi:hypothetical protein KPC83_02325 [Collinsella sp. zg1085]|uniref:hypothetical protein n=1 Tax=Collinsella sp. zg1085 TaxID=2844380 RepID=UPI001C0D705E|nr:hypothetical protein [Collinsella sp. zg1085]QWT17994.1 hypothetical protein KPC83_02325 [Collinsella sp. zg1085]
MLMAEVAGPVIVCVLAIAAVAALYFAFSTLKDKRRQSRDTGSFSNRDNSF